jgi:hypothetical protein
VLQDPAQASSLNKMNAMARKLNVFAKQLEICAIKDTLNGLNAFIENL